MSAGIAQTALQLHPASISAITQAADALRSKGENILVFSMGRPDFDTPEHIKEAARKALAAGQVHYAHSRGILPMRKAVADYLKQRNGLTYDPETEIIITAGGQQALMLCFNLLVDAGDEVLIPSPGFLLYYSGIPLTGGRPVPYILKEPHYMWDGAPVTDRTKLFVLNTPHNPTGRVLSEAEMRDIARFVLKHDLIAISDEAYDRLVFDNTTHRSLAAEKGMRDRTLLVGSLSKSFSMTGWRLGYIAGPARYIERLDYLVQNHVLAVHTFPQFGGVAALSGPQDCVEAMRKAFEQRCAVFAAGLEGAPKIRFNKPEGTFYLFVDHTETGLDAPTFCRRLLEEAHVACVPGDDFGPSAVGHIRISCTSNQEDCAEGARRIRNFLEAL